MNTSSAFTFRSAFPSKIEIYEIKFSVVKSQFIAARLNLRKMDGNVLTFM